MSDNRNQASGSKPVEKGYVPAASRTPTATASNPPKGGSSVTSPSSTTKK